jgi:hypothetical protein
LRHLLTQAQSGKYFAQAHKHLLIMFVEPDRYEHNRGSRILERSRTRIPRRASQMNGLHFSVMK